MKKIILLTLLLLSVTIPTFANDPIDEPGRHEQQRAEQQIQKEQYYKRAINNQIYFLPQDQFNDRSPSFVYFIKEFKNGFQRGQRLVGNMGTDQEYVLYVIGSNNNTTFALLEHGNPNDIQRYDRMLIGTRYGNPE